MPVIQPSIEVEGGDGIVLPDSSSQYLVFSGYTPNSFNVSNFTINTTLDNLGSSTLVYGMTKTTMYAVHAGTQDASTKYLYKSNAIFFIGGKTVFNNYSTNATGYYTTLKGGTTWTQSNVATLSNGDYKVLAVVNSKSGALSSIEEVSMGMTNSTIGISGYVLLDLTVNGSNYTFTYNGPDRYIPSYNTGTQHRLIGMLICVFGKD